MNKLIENIDLRFKSGNSVPVTSIRLTDDEWHQLRRLVSAARPAPEPAAMGVVACWRGLNSLGEVVTDWIDGPKPEKLCDLHGTEADYASTQFAYFSPPAPAAREAVDLDKIKADARLRAAIYAMVNLVEGAGCARWAADSVRLKDTQEWVSFYLAAKALRNGQASLTTPPPEAAGDGFVMVPVEWMQRANEFLLKVNRDEESMGYAVVQSADLSDEIEAMIAGWGKALPRTIPEGFVLTRINATKGMEDAGLVWLTNFQHMRKQDQRNALANAYDAMVKAAAPPPAGAGKGVAP